ncbi:hydroxyacylglutathione hydrolase-like protein [Eurosta solidaginis]|uniref:hydroxyacylglutathione hydrolase-like protein n=1 Tax=Eurosta solidaginis TaxID=178769 RepID=UPI003530D7B6
MTSLFCHVLAQKRIFNNVWRARRFLADSTASKPPASPSTPSSTPPSSAPPPSSAAPPTVATPPKPHSQIVDVHCEGMIVKIIPARANNYMYLVKDKQTGCAAIIDLSDNKVLFEVLKKENLKLTYAFITHHHEDHSGGTVELAAQCPDVKICAGDERIKAVTHCVKNCEKLQVGKLTVHCMHTPCHTVGHYCYFVECGAGGPPALFTGDTLFQGGCGGFDEGTPEQMYSIVKRFLALPQESRVFGGHENTILNLRFAETVEPENSNITARLAWAQKQREKHMPTPPSLLCQERLWNPFMRVDHPDVQHYTGDTDPIYATFCLRKQRDAFK